MSKDGRDAIHKSNQEAVEENDMTQRELAEKIGVNEVQMSWMCTGRKAPREIDVVNICRLFNVSREEIL